MNFICPIRIIDGLFIGDQATAHDLDFLVLNKITRVVNCAAKQLPNHWESLGIIYLALQWLESEIQFNFDHAKCFNFINEAIISGESVLVHSVKGQNRSAFLICFYLMKKFRWTLFKTIQYFSSVKQDLDIRQNIFGQLMKQEEWLQVHKIGAKTNNWDQAFSQDELLIRNTYLNSLQLSNQELTSRKSNKKKKNNIVHFTKTLISQWIPPYNKIQFSTTASSKKSIHQHQSPNPISLKFELNFNSHQYIPKKLTLSQLVDQQLQKKLEQNQFRVRINNFVDNRATISRPQTAPIKKIQPHRLLKSNSHRSPLTKRQK